MQERGLRVNASEIGGRAVLAPQGALTLETSETFSTALEKAGQGQGAEVVLDCQAIPFMDSSALEILLDAHESLEHRGGALRLIRLNDVVRDILMATRLGTLLHVYGSLEAAVGHRSSL